MKQRFNYYNDTYRMAFSLWVGNQSACSKDFRVRGVRPIIKADRRDAGLTQTIVDTHGNVLQILIYLKRMRFFTDDYVTLAHECLHAAEFCLISRGIAFGSKQFDGDETLAYLLGAVYSDFLRQLHDEYKKERE